MKKSSPALEGGLADQNETKAAARNTSSAPSKFKDTSDDAALVKAVHTGELAEAMPFNSMKAAEYGMEAGLQPPKGNAMANFNQVQ